MRVVSLLKNPSKLRTGCGRLDISAQAFAAWPSKEKLLQAATWGTFIVQRVKLEARCKGERVQSGPRQSPHSHQAQ
jgi:hypothetical protein